MRQGKRSNQGQVLNNPLNLHPHRIAHSDGTTAQDDGQAVASAR
jgi:hypothetical protein